MTNLTFNELDKCFRTNDFPSIENDTKGVRFLKLRSMSRKATMEEFCGMHDLNITELSSKQYFQFVFECEDIIDEQINAFINSKYLNGILSLQFFFIF